jgi:hypothetical protein
MFDVDVTAAVRCDLCAVRLQATPTRRCVAIDLLYYRHVYFREHEAAYVNKIRSLLSQATWINELEGFYRQLEVREIPAWLNQARVGLCLSAYEGCMRASAEYLLCGLPIVSTPNIGGRDRLADRASGSKPSRIRARSLQRSTSWWHVASTRIWFAGRPSRSFRATGPGW